jgi:HK97 family phage major capsid protein
MKGHQVMELSHKQALNREKDIQEELERITAKETRSEEDFTRSAELYGEFKQVHAHRLTLEHDAAVSEIRSALEAGRTETSAPEQPADSDPVGQPASIRNAPVFRNPWDVSEMRWGMSPQQRAHELRERAKDAIERMQGANDAVREASTEFVERWDTADGRIAQQVLASSSPDYLRAFAKLLRSQGNAAVLDGVESAAYTRAMSLTDSAGGYLVPFQLDPTVILTAAGSRNPIRRIARVVNATGDVWAGISSAGVTGSWDAEAAEVSDDAPTFAQPTIPVYKGAVFVPISLEAQQDEQNVAQEIGRMIAFEKDRMEAVAFTTGSGLGEPTGIVTALTGTASVVASAGADTFAIGDIYALDSGLPTRYAENASWLMHRAIANLVRRFDTSGGANLWETLGNSMPAQLLGRPAYYNEAMDNAIDATVDNFVTVFGDFTNYVIADRIGTTVEYIPHLFGANRRPTGQRGWYAYFRVGADSVNDAAFRMLNVT